MGGLRLDSREGVLKGGKSGPAAVEGKSADSLLIQAVTHSHEKLKMPPSGKLPEADIAVLRSWIDGGVYWPEGDKPALETKGKITPEQRAFWSFQPVKPPAPGASIDAFIRARLEKEGLRQVRPADKRTLIRRATLDLIGLPPTPEEVDAFRERQLARRLRESGGPAAGLAPLRRALGPLLARRRPVRGRSASTPTQDEPYPNSWRYRNWVIQAFNDDMPYDLFVKAQIAGDRCSETRNSAWPRILRAQPGDAGRPCGCHHPRLPRTDGRLRDLPRPQIRPDPDEGLLLASGRLRQYGAERVAAGTEGSRRSVDKEKKQVETQQAVIDKFYERQRQELAEILASQTARYLLATAQAGAVRTALDEDHARALGEVSGRSEEGPPVPEGVVRREDATTNCAQPPGVRDGRRSDERREGAGRRAEHDHPRAGSRPRPRRRGDLESLTRDKYILWRDLFEKSHQGLGGLLRL